MRKTDRALENFRHCMTCAAAVLDAFREDAGLSDAEIRENGGRMAGGKMQTCGAVLAAKMVLARKYGENDPRVEALEERFRQKNQTALCRELKHGPDGKAIRSCPACVTDAAGFLEEILAG